MHHKVEREVGEVCIEWCACKVTARVRATESAEPLLGLCVQVTRVSLPVPLRLQSRPVPVLAPQLWPLPELLPSPWARRRSPRALLVGGPHQNAAPHQL